MHARGLCCLALACLTLYTHACSAVATALHSRITVSAIAACSCTNIPGVADSIGCHQHAVSCVKNAVSMGKLGGDALLAAGWQKQWLHSRSAIAASWPTQQTAAVHAVQKLEPDIPGGCRAPELRCCLLTNALNLICWWYACYTACTEATDCCTDCALGCSLD